VRYRRKDSAWLLTVKSDAASPGGLAQRREWEAPGQPGEFDFSHVDNPKLRRFLEAAIPELAPVFSTDFTRSFWLLTPQEGTRIEVALDRGKIVAGDHQEAICEVELELLEGKVTDLFDAALSLQKDLPLHPESASKAERGYRLADETTLKPAKAADASGQGCRRGAGHGDDQHRRFPQHPLFVSGATPGQRAWAARDQRS